MGLVLGLWYFAPGGRRALLGPQRQRLVPWTSTQLLAAVVFMNPIAGIWPILAATLLAATRLFGTNDKGSPPAPQFALQFEFCAVLLALPFQLATPLVFFGLASNARPYQLGITLKNCGRNLVAGVIGFVTFTPCSYLVLGIAAMLVEQLLRHKPEQHRLIQQLGASPGALELVLTVAVATIAAPLVEELLFRGVLQPWFIARRFGGHVAMGAALVMAVLVRFLHNRSAWNRIWSTNVLAMVNELSPLIFVLLVLPGYIYLYRRFRDDPSPRRAWPAIYSTALLFAIMHSSAWPQPVALFVLALGLGLAAYRTQSLLPSVVMHALFNTVAFVFLLAAPVHVEEPEKGSEETSAVRFEPSISISTEVPGSW
jgi:membrane protease YdiL (CAAX protease family)